MNQTQQPDLGISALLANLEKRAEAAALGEATRHNPTQSPGNGGEQGGGGGNRAWRRNNARREKSHATEAPQGQGAFPGTGKGGALGLGTAWCDACNKMHVGGSGQCWVHSEKVLADAPAHVRRAIADRLTGKNNANGTKDGEKGGGKGRPKGGRDNAHPTVEGSTEQVQALVQDAVKSTLGALLA